MGNRDAGKQIRSDREEYRNLAEACREEMFSVCYAVLNRPAEAHEIVCRTVADMYASHTVFPPKTNPADVLCREAYRRAREFREKNRHTQPVLPTVAAGGGDVVSNDKKTFIIHIEQDVKLALTILPDDQREAVLLRDACGFSYERIEFITGASAGMVRSRVGLARTGIKNILMKKWDV